jgi:predicted transcriptional regulator
MMDDKIKELLNLDKYLKFLQKHPKIKKRIDNFQSALKNRISFLIMKNLKEKFILYYGENVKNRMMEFI